MKGMASLYQNVQSKHCNKRYSTESKGLVEDSSYQPLRWRDASSFLTYTRGSADVCGVASLTETPERAHGIDALTIGAEIWHNFTFVNVCAPKTPRQKQTEVNIDARIKPVRS